MYKKINNRMLTYYCKIFTLLKLGPKNIIKVLFYRQAIKFSLHPACFIKTITPSPPFFTTTDKDIKPQEETKNVHYPQPVIHHDKFDAFSKLNWWQIPDFDSDIGDIKAIWEYSRFDWVISLALSEHPNKFSLIEALLERWLQLNPLYKGFNWKCGQEASIRVMHLLMASLILKKIDSPTHGFKTLIESHLKRIAPTLGYATAQNNNHVTSEAAALYLGGGFLKLHGVKRGAYWYNIGKKQLEKSVQKLVSKDGTFSQYSVNYHRVFLDTVCMVEILNRYFNFSEFSKTYYKKLIAATHWLYSFTNPFNGEAPNIGANDGAKLLPIGNLEYLDYRATVQLSSILFSGKRAFSAEGEWNEPCTILNVALPKEQRSEPYSKIFADGGFVFMKRKAAFVAMRYPHFKFRPSQADAMHVDLWVKGENLLRDAGTYSYNTEPQWMRYFSGTKSHNTVEFDGRDQMPRIGRFLFGSWLRLKHHSNLEEDNEAVKFSASYEDYKKARHSRTVELKDNFLRVTDECVGFEKKAILRWRLRPGNWRIANNTLYNEKESIKVISNVEIEDFRLVLGWESRYYGKKAKLPVLEVEICNPGAFITEYSW